MPKISLALAAWGGWEGLMAAALKYITLLSRAIPQTGGDRLGPHSNVNKLYLVKLPHKKINRGGGVVINNKLDVRNSYEIPDS